MPTNNHHTLRKILSLSAYLLVAVAVAYLLIDRHPIVLAPKSLAPVDTTYYRLSGGTSTIRRMLDKPLVVNFFATWCPPCQKELPALSKVYRQYAGKIGFLGLAVSSNVPDIINLKRKFLIDYELGTIVDDALEIWQARAMPTTYILDKNGRILWAHAGLVTEEQLSQAISEAIR